MIAICVLAATSISAAEEPNSSSDSKISHLSQAARSLEQAGEDELADRVRQRLVERKQADLELLDKLRKKRDELTLEIDRLTRELELAGESPAADRPAVLLHVNMFRVDLDRLRKLRPEFAEELLAGLDTAPQSQERNLPSPEMMRRLFEVANHGETAEPLLLFDVDQSLRLPLGEKVTSFSGGEIETPLPGTQNETCEIGTRVTATIDRHEDGEWQGRLMVRHATTNYAYAAEAADGTLIPGLHVRSVDTRIKAKAREPQVITGLIRQEQGRNYLMMVMIVLEPEQPAMK
jgi:hypothetical protein